MFVLRKKTRNNEHSCACFFNRSCPLLHNPCHLRENSPPLTKTTVKSSCELTFLNQTAHFHFIIWSKIFLILCSRLNQNEATSGKVGRGGEGTVQRSVTCPTGFPSQVMGTFGLASTGDLKAEDFLPFLHPFMTYKAEGSSAQNSHSILGFSPLLWHCIYDCYWGPSPGTQLLCAS